MDGHAGNSIFSCSLRNARRMSPSSSTVEPSGERSGEGCSSEVVESTLLPSGEATISKGSDDDDRPLRRFLDDDPELRPRLFFLFLSFEDRLFLSFFSDFPDLSFLTFFASFRLFFRCFLLFLDESLLSSGVSELDPGGVEGGSGSCPAATAPIAAPV